MTSMQIYGLAASFLVLALGGLAVWWDYRTVMKHRRDAKSEHAQSAE
jgi:hypothetical protein